MKNLRVMNTREVKKLLNEISAQWGCCPDFEFAFLKNEKEGKIFIVNREIEKIDISRLKINSLGLYFTKKGNEISLSIEGSQIIGPGATRNVVEVDDKDAALWLRGYDLDIETDAEGFAIIRHNDDFLGTGKVKGGSILNHVPKIRRIFQKSGTRA